ncbi:MAG: sulfatase/phosphatase domain-containing protein [Bacteroidota bacterium]
MQGESFRKLVSGKSDKWRDADYYTYYEYPAEHIITIRIMLMRKK